MKKALADASAFFVLSPNRSSTPPKPFGIMIFRDTPRDLHAADRYSAAEDDAPSVKEVARGDRVAVQIGGERRIAL